jgi:hypothetical protein
MIKFKYEKKKKKEKRMWCGTCLTSILYDKIIKIPSKSHETIPLKEQSRDKFCEIIISDKLVQIMARRQYLTLLVPRGTTVSTYLLRNDVESFRYDLDSWNL